MVQLIVGNRGKGKTQCLIDSANDTVAKVDGNVVYFDKSSKHMLELSNKIRLIDISTFQIKGFDQLEGFICGVLSQDYDLEYIYIDSFSYFADIQETVEDLEKGIALLERIGNAFGVNFVLSVSADKAELSETLQEKVILAL